VFFLSDSLHYQCAQDNPVVAVFTTLEAAKDLVRRIIKARIDRSNEELHMVVETPDSELVYKVGAFDSSDLCVYSYSVIKIGMMV
jgi:hypothetical protein